MSDETIREVMRVLRGLADDMEALSPGDERVEQLPRAWVVGYIRASAEAVDIAHRTVQS